MKKIVFSAIALFAIASSTYSFTSVAVAEKPTAKPMSIPPATCPANSPNGCGIFG
jgi:hypothetical protein